MIIEIPNENSIVKWKNDVKDEWKVAEISDLIKVYERLQGEWIEDSISRSWVEHNVLSLVDAETRIYAEQRLDNAPTVELNYMTAYFNGFEMAKQIHERPQGEWIEVGDNQPYSKDKLYGCSKCRFGSYLLSDTKNVNFCSNCGADMRKPNCVTCDHFGKCDGCEKREEE